MLEEYKNNPEKMHTIRLRAELTYLDGAGQVVTKFATSDPIYDKKSKFSCDVQLEGPEGDGRYDYCASIGGKMVLRMGKEVAKEKVQVALFKQVSLT